MAASRPEGAGRFRRTGWGIAIAVLALVGIGAVGAVTGDWNVPLPFGAGSGNGPQGEMVIQEIQVEDVEVRIAESDPIQVYAQVRGILGDGCTELHGVTQERSGNEIVVRITARRPKDAVCSLVAQIYEDTLRLEGPFEAGSYLLRVNDVATPFSVP